MKSKKGVTQAMLVVSILSAFAVGGLLMYLTQAPSAQMVVTGEPGAPTILQTGPGYATTVAVSAVNAITGASIVDADGWLYYANNAPLAKDVNINAATTSLSTSAPNTFNGYLMLGNDANQGTDRGTEYYYRKIPVSYSNTGRHDISEVGSGAVQLQPEATSVTWTGYDDGSAEATLNVTVGTAIVTSTELKLEPAASTVFGNPDFDNPVGVCFNESTSGQFDAVKPSNYVGTFVRPEVLRSYNIIGCYVLPTGAIADDNDPTTNQNYKFYVTIDPNSNPDSSVSIYAFPMDKTWFIDDLGVWQSGWGDNSEKGTDYDPGMAAIGNEKQIALA